MNPIQVALMSKYDLYPKRKQEYKPKNRKSLRVPVNSILFAVAVIFLLVALPAVYSSSPSSQTVVQDWTNTRSVNLGAFGAFQTFGSSPADSEIGNCFTTPKTTSNTFTISDVQVRLNGAVGMPSGGQLQVVIYNTFGSIRNSTCVPNFSTGTIGNSLSTNPSMIDSTTTGNVTFTFLILPAQVVLRGNTTYAMSVRLVGCSVCGNSANYWLFGVDATNPSISVLSFRVGSMNVTTPQSPSTPSLLQSYYWNGTTFIPNIPVVITAGSGGGSGGGGGGCRALKV